MRTLSSSAKRELFASQTGAVFLTVLQCIHTSMTTIYLVNNNESITYDGNTYEPYGFSFAPPEDSEGGVSTSKLLLDNIDRDILIALRSISTPITVKAALVMVLGGTVSKEAGWWEFDLKNVSYDAFQISGDLYYDINVRSYAGQTSYSNLTFPGLYG